jgi:DNA-binding MarR family transcriptional regulator
MTIITQSALTTNPTPTLSTQEIDVELFTFIERYATNLVRWDLLIFFGRHPAMRLEAPQVAQHIGRPPRLVQKELDDLVYLGIVRVYQSDGQVQYGLTRSTSTRRAVIRMARDYTPQRI